MGIKLSIEDLHALQQLKRKVRRTDATQEEAPALLVARAPLLHAHGAPEATQGWGV